jgi:orotate phosphoribosyltransferase
MRAHFISFLIEHHALTFGDFTLKSGRQCPFFFNLGAFQTGAALQQLGRFYADAIEQSEADYDLIYGPAYKGIPLVSATAIALNKLYQKDIPYCFNRKEPKTHGEAGLFVGAAPAGSVIILDDVITAGKTLNETMQLLSQTPAQVTGMIIALDRQEKSEQGSQSAVQAAAERYQIPIQSIINMQDLMEFIETHADYQQWVGPMKTYRATYGA